MNKLQKTLQVWGNQIEETPSLSYKELRRHVGLAGILLPVVLIVGGLIAGNAKILPTISHYYFSSMGDVFVGIIVAIGFFLYSYKCTKLDNWFANAAGIAAVAVAVFPTESPYPAVPWIHSFAALVFFCLMAYFCLEVFPNKLDDDEVMAYANAKAKIYWRAGIIIILCITILISYFLLNHLGIIDWSAISFVLIIETVALWAFGVAWMVKGESLRFMYKKKIPKKMQAA
ncbi:MAG: hypothetical protein AAGC85_07770 [Bacteroidota bacterium]